MNYKSQAGSIHMLLVHSKCMRDAAEDIIIPRYQVELTIRVNPQRAFFAFGSPLEGVWAHAWACTEDDRSKSVCPMKSNEHSKT